MNKKFTILHSSDMHGQFLADHSHEREESLIGGLAFLSGYINKVREEEENVLYVVAGDLLQGSLIDSEYRGISTKQMVNYLAPDVVTLGNHEFDYGLPHLLFLEKMAHFPIVNANLYIRDYHKRLMQPHIIVSKGGLNTLFTGIITEKVIDSIKRDRLISTFITIEEASQEVGRICNAYVNDDIDLTVLLTHIGIDSDIELARLLKPEWGVDLIIGGHSHTFMHQPEKVNDILIAHAGTGTNQVGRFDIVVDSDANSIVDHCWRLVEIDDSAVEPDKELGEYIESLRSDVDRKYNTIITKLACKLTHPKREIETSLGNLVADALAEADECDVMLVGSGSIRSEEVGPLVTLRDLRTFFPFDDTLTRYTVSGAELKKMFAHIMRPENRRGQGECYQVNEKVRAIYDGSEHRLASLSIEGTPVSDNQYYTVCLQEFHFDNAERYLGIRREELTKSPRTKVVATSAQQVLEEYLRNHQNMNRCVEARLVYQGET
jgi:5'-nucleotidase/UDP-sugar diphosphatase